MRFTLSRKSRGPLALIIASILAPATGTALAQDQAEPISQQAFVECKARLEQQAIEAGVSQATASQVMAQVEHLDRVIELDRRQPEFTTTFADYLNRRVNEARVSKGREMLAEHRDLLQRVTDETGVPAPYLVAFWGLEQFRQLLRQDVCAQRPDHSRL